MAETTERSHFDTSLDDLDLQLRSLLCVCVWGGGVLFLFWGGGFLEIQQTSLLFLQISQSLCIKFGTLPQYAGLLKLALNIFND